MTVTRERQSPGEFVAGGASGEPRDFRFSWTVTSCEWLATATAWEGRRYNENGAGMTLRRGGLGYGDGDYGFKLFC